MGTFTRLDDDDVSQIAAGFGLGPVAGWRAIAAGTINSNFEVEAGGGRWFVRVNEGKAEADVAWEAGLCADLAAAGLPVPVPRPGPDRAGYLRHRGLLISAFSWLDGHHRAAADVTTGDAGAVGAFLARLHLAGRAFAGERKGGIYTPAHVRARFEAFRGSSDPALAVAIERLAAELAWLDAHAAARAAAPRGVIHGDLFRDNVLWAGADLVAVLDFEQASWGSWVYDLAVTVNDWCWDGGPRPDLATALIAGYQDVRPLDPAEARALPIELRGAAARFTVTRITDVYLPGIPGPDKDFRDYLARLRAWQNGALGPLDPARVRSAE
jgi:homoserine kinase type II